MTIEDLLKGKVIENPIKKYKKELAEMVDAGLISKLLSKNKLKTEVAEFGLCLLNLKDNYSCIYVSLGSEELKKFEKWIKPDMWEDKNYYDLLVYFFGAESAAYVKESWNRLPQKMYQSGYGRRSFRAPNNSRFLVVNQINFLRSLLEGPHLYNYQNSVYYDLSIEDQIRYDTEITNPVNQFMLWSAAIDSGNANYFQLFEDIIFNKDPNGKVSRNIIKALLNSNKKECWELVEKLLLAAQRQEGLRQTILEALDETSIGALQYMIKVIIDQKLTRFSSVVRAIDTWTGLGWEAEKETTVRNIIQLASDYFSNPESLVKAIQSKNNNEVYMALWVQGVIDVEKTVPYLHDLLDNGSVEKKCLAIKFAGETGDPYIEMPLYFKALNDDNLQVLAFVMPRMNGLLHANTKSKHYIDNPEYPNFFEKVYSLAESISIKEKVFEGKVFSWLTVKFEKDSLFAAAIYLIGDKNERLELILNQFESLSIDLRTNVTREILKELFSYGYYAIKSTDKNAQIVPTDFQRNFALRILKDRGESLVASAINVLNRVALKEEELASFQELLKRKNATLKSNLIAIIVKQEDAKIETFVNQTLENGDLEQRMSVLDVLLQLQKANKLNDKVNNWIKAYEKRPKITERETKFIEQLAPEKKSGILSAENGFGFYNPNEISSYELPKVTPDSLYSKSVKAHQYGFSKSFSHVKSEIAKLYQLFETHKNYEYQVEQYDNSRETVLLGNTFREVKYLKGKESNEETAMNYPLYEVWSDWFTNSGLVEQDLFLLTHTNSCDRKVWRDFLEKQVFYYQDILPNPIKNGYYWNHPILNILNALQLKYIFTEKNDFLIDACSALFASLPKSILDYEHVPGKNEYYYNSDRGNGWQDQIHFNVYLNSITINELTDEQNIKAWNLYRWRQFHGVKRNIEYNRPPIELYCSAFEQKLISEGELYEGILVTDRISRLTGKRKNYKTSENDDLIQKFPFLGPMIDTIRETFLDIEVKRGDSNTAVTHFVQNFERVYGINRFAEMLSGLGKASLFKGYISSWSSEALNKQKLFSFLLKKCFPLESDSQQLFNESIKKAKISEERLIQAAIYAPQWQKLISNYLDWKGLDEGIWWLHAHTKTSAYGDVNAELESEVARFSSIDLQDFKDGAVDKDWFLSAYKQLGSMRWEMLYESAKYVTDGNGHRRAKLYSNTLTGDLKIREVTAKVKDKRDQDYLRVYGLVPLSKTIPEKDILARYEYLQQFKKESKEFGSMKQTSEALAIRVALENLARNAGYPDPIRLTWAMETKQVQNILSKETEVVIDDSRVSLVINKEGKADLQVFNLKTNKEVKAIPPKIKKEKAILELLTYRKTMREQWTRSRKGLEESMIRGDEFLFAEMQNLFEHPIISKHLEKLVFISNDNQIGFFVDGNLISSLGEVQKVNEKQTFRIAHCYDLHIHKVWTDFQSYCFDTKLQQPFKQVFRELYVPTADELNEKAISRRYAGHQVNPKQTLALLKNRGWKVDYEEGLQKVFHKEGYQVKMYAMADWFSPADVESPTLETIEFHSLKDYINIAFEEINPRIFSEVMRDIDLVVSVAHVGGVDPETSQSSIEMRTVLLRETLRLFKIKNVEVKGNHAHIKGEMANYSIHLGSAIVHQVPGKYLSVLPVHSQHRGRLFLPFADDDPKSAEVMSKVLLFANDSKIQDPTILSQIDKELSSI